MLRLATFAVLALSVFGLCTGAVAADLDEQQLAFNNHCRNCHSAKKDDHRLGPSMHGIFDAPAGQAVGYRAYSGGLKGIVWDAATLDRFLADPTSISASTSMIFPPVADPAERAKIIAYLRSLAGR